MQLVGEWRVAEERHDKEVSFYRKTYLLQDLSWTRVILFLGCCLSPL
jgi:hypothetical protein